MLSTTTYYTVLSFFAFLRLLALKCQAVQAANTE